jgi:tetratricopeptide (TPR) repeat protein
VLAGRYAIEREIGRGGMAVVYLARDLRHVRDVAVKIFRLEGEYPGEGSQRFLQEIQIAARLSHPNILPLHDSGEAEGLLYYVMPYVPGESLRQRLDREGALPVTDSLRIAVEVAGALAYAHSHGVIHRDIKPENILFIADHAVVADFGIARAISAGGWDEWKLAGPAGTPTYMSPEQARGGSRVDGRSDVYSLGCVLYEMLTGEPPFRGSTPEEVAVQHLEVEPEPVQSRRPTLAPELQAAVGRALAKHPADRYQTAQQMADALGRLEPEDTGPRASGGSLRRGSTDHPAPAREEATSWLARWAAPGLAALGIALAVVWTTALRHQELEPSLYLVGPLVQREGVPSRLSGDQSRRLLHDALSRWDGVRLSDRRWVEDQLARVKEPATLEDLFGIARRGGAGRLLAGEVSTWGDSIRVRGVLYDVARGPEVLREKTVTLAGSLVDVEQKFAELADSLLLPRPLTASAASGIFGTRVIGAWEAYDSAHASLARWDLSGAARRFRAALALDPNYGLAHLWLAQTMNWQGEGPGAWRDEAVAGMQGQPPLMGQEALWARALVALGEERFPDACRQYDAMIRRDTLDFRAWFGRAECRARDHAVLRDPASPTGWAFRSGYQAAISDYHRALTLVPSVHRAFRGAAFQRLAGLFYAEPSVFRWGAALPPDTMRFAAFPALRKDTLAFVPYRLADLDQARGEMIPDGPASPRVHNLGELRQITAMWVSAFPESPDAWEARASLLEASGDLEGGAQDTSAALPAVRRALRLAAARIDSLRLRATEAQLLVKLGRFAEASRLADSTLAGLTAPTPAESREAAGLAALTGKAGALAGYLRLASGLPQEDIGDPAPAGSHPALRASLASLLAYSVLGGPSDSAVRWLRIVDDQIRAYIPQDSRARYRAEALELPLMLLQPTEVANLPVPGAPPRMYLRRFQSLLQQGDTAAVRSGLDTLARLRTAVRPADVSLDAVYHEAVLHLAIGDSAMAVRHLDQVLNSLPAARLTLVHYPPETAALVRAMMLRARLAVGLRDDAAARRWAVAATALWAGADAGLQASVDTMRRIARSDR